MKVTLSSFDEKIWITDSRCPRIGFTGCQCKDGVDHDIGVIREDCQRAMIAIGIPYIADGDNVEMEWTVPLAPLEEEAR